MKRDASQYNGEGQQQQQQQQQPQFFADSRVQKEYDAVCEAFPLQQFGKGTQVHFTALCECEICTGGGQKIHATPEWIHMSNMDDEAWCFTPICDRQKTNPADAQWLATYYGNGQSNFGGNGQPNNGGNGQQNYGGQPNNGGNGQYGF